MTNIYEDGARQNRKEVLRLKGFRIQIATDEQIAKGRLKNEDFKPNATFVIEWEPLSYRLEGGRYGNLRTEYLPFTFGRGLDPEEIEQVRQHGWRGAGNTGKRMTIPKTVAEARDVWPYFMVKAREAGIEIEIDEAGQPQSPQVGTAFEVEAGTITLPTRVQDEKTGKWRNSDPSKGERAYTPYVRIPVRAVPDYVIPENVPVIVIAGGDDDDAAAPAPTTTASAGSNVSADLLYAACVEAGIIGAQADEFAGMPKQVDVTNRYIGRAPVFGSKEVQDAAAAGELINYLVAKGAVTVNNGVIEKAA